MNVPSFGAGEETGISFFFGSPAQEEFLPGLAGAVQGAAVVEFSLINE